MFFAVLAVSIAPLETRGEVDSDVSNHRVCTMLSAASGVLCTALSTRVGFSWGASAPTPSFASRSGYRPPLDANGVEAFPRGEVPETQSLVEQWLSSASCDLPLDSVRLMVLLNQCLLKPLQRCLVVRQPPLVDLRMIDIPAPDSLLGWTPSIASVVEQLTRTVIDSRPRTNVPGNRERANRILDVLHRFFVDRDRDCGRTTTSRATLRQFVEGQRPPVTATVPPEAGEIEEPAFPAAPSVPDFGDASEWNRVVQSTRWMLDGLLEWDGARRRAQLWETTRIGAAAVAFGLVGWRAWLARHAAVSVGVGALSVPIESFSSSPVAVDDRTRFGAICMDAVGGRRILPRVEWDSGAQRWRMASGHLEVDATRWDGYFWSELLRVGRPSLWAMACSHSN